MGHPPRLALGIGAALLATVTSSLLAVRAADADDPIADPIPLRRVLISPERLPVELERLREGILERHSRAEFEAMVRKAARANLAIEQPPLLVEAHYRATLNDMALEGTGEWKVVGPPPVGILPIPALNLALRQMRWADGKPALLLGPAQLGPAGLDGLRLGLRVEQAGERSATLEWSARGVPAAGGLHFNLEVPACALASLELDLPEDRIALVSRETGLLSGPHPSARAGHQTWRIDFAGKSAINLTIRRIQGPNLPPPLVLVRTQARQDLAPGQVLCDHEFDLEVRHGGIHECVFECDPALRPYDVQVRNLDTWDFQPGPGPTEPGQLVVRFRQPFQGESLLLQVHALAALPSERTWTSPYIRLAGASAREENAPPPAPSSQATPLLPVRPGLNPRPERSASIATQGESLWLRVHPEVQLQDWQPGGFRTNRAPSPESGTAKPRPENWMVVPLLAGLDAGPNPKRPTARVRTSGSEFRVHQALWWHIDGEKTTLTARVQYEVVQGRLFRLPLLLPAGWKVEQVDLSPSTLLRNWNEGVELGRPILTIDLQRALTSLPAPAAASPEREPLGARSRGAVLLIRLRPAKPFPVSREGVSLPFPDLIPLGAASREGALGITVSPRYQAVARPPSYPLLADEEPRGRPSPDPSAGGAPLPPRLPAASRPWGSQTLDWYYPHRAQTVAGTIQLKSRSAELRVRCAGALVFSAGRAGLTSRIHVQAERGPIESIDVFLSAASAWTPEWRVVKGSNQVVRSSRLLAVEAAPLVATQASRSLVEVIAPLAVARVSGTWWRLTLAKPLQDGEQIELEARRELTGAGLAVDPAVDLPVLAAGQPLEAAVLTAARIQAVEHLAGERRWEVPLVTVPTADHLEGELDVYRSGMDLVLQSVTGLREVPSRLRADTPAPWRSFRHGHPPLHLVIRGRPSVTEISSEAVADAFSAVTSVHADSRLVHHYRFQVWNWRQRTLPIQVPAHAIIVGARADGRAIDRLAAPEALGGDGTGTPAVMVLELPVATGQPRHSYEVVLMVDHPAWKLGTRVEAPPLGLPVRTLGYRHTWQLAPGIVPLNDAKLIRNPRPGVRDGTPGSWWISLPWIMGTTPAGEATGRSTQALHEALARQRAQHPAGRDLSLGAALERLTLEYLRESGPLVVDEWALGEAGLHPTTSIPAQAWSETPAGSVPPAPSSPIAVAPWDRLGLVFVPCRTGHLLTTSRHLETVQAGDRTLPLPAGISQAVAEAAQLGSDSSGRYLTTLNWLQTGVESGARLAARRGFGLPAIPEDWVEWEYLAGQEASAVLWVVHGDRVLMAGMVVSILLVLVQLSLAGSARPRAVRLWMVALASSGFGLLWLPGSLQALAWYPALTAIVLGAIQEFRHRARRAPLPPSSSLLTPATSSLMLAVLALMGELLVVPRLWPGLQAMPALANTADAQTVFIVPTPAGSPDRESVLVSRDLADQLRRLARRGASALQGASLVAAHYQGQVQQHSIQFEVRYDLHSFGDDVTSLALPLGGINLQEAILDGAPAYLVALRPGKGEGYVLDVKGAGLHTLRLKFTVPIQATEDDREVVFRIPDLYRSRLSLEANPGACFVHLVDIRGLQTQPTPRRLEADLGQIGTVRLRWRQDEGIARPVAMTVQEAYLWELHPTAARLLGVLQYRVSRGAASTLWVQLPRDLEVYGVDAGSLPDGPPTPRLREWQLVETGGQRRLKLDFLWPVTSGVQVTLDLVARQPLGPHPQLLFPSTRDAQTTDCLLAYRLDGFESVPPEARSIRGIDSVEPAFAKFLDRPWRYARQERIDPPTLAFWREKGGTPYLRVRLQPAATLPQCAQDITWQVGQRQADFLVTARVKGTEGKLALLEWSLPPGSTVADVSGRDIRSWSRTGSRVQVWIQRLTGTDDDTVSLQGWMPRSGEAAAFELPPLRLLSPRPFVTTVRVRGGEGQFLTLQSSEGFGPLPDVATREPEWAAVVLEAGARATFAVGSPSLHTQVRQLTFVEVRERQLHFVATVECQPRQGELRRLAVHLRNWDGTDVRLDGPRLVQRRELPPGPRGRTWLLELEPGVTGAYAFTLTGSVRLDHVLEVRMPDVRLEGTLPAERWLAFAGADLAGEGSKGLTLITDGPRALQGWPREANLVRRAGGMVWKVESEDWRLRLRSRVAQEQPAALRLLLAEQVAAVMDGRRWLHQGLFWLYHEAGSELTVQLPPGSSLVAAAMDGTELIASHRQGEHLRFPMPAGTGVRLLQLGWTFDPTTETLLKPELSMPQLAGTEPSPGLWTLYLPPGCEVGSMEGPPRAAAAGQDLRRAAVQAGLFKLLEERASRSRDDSLPRQVEQCLARLDRFNRWAEHHLLSTDRKGTADRGPDGRGLEDWLQQLREQHRQLASTLPAEPRPEDRGQPGERLLIQLPSQGTPLYWHASGSRPAPLVRLRPTRAIETRDAIACTGLLAVILLVSAGLHRLFGSQVWPEQLALLSSAGWVLFGSELAWLFVLFPALWLVIRLWALVRGVVLQVQRIFTEQAEREAKEPAEQVNPL